MVVTVLLWVVVTVDVGIWDVLREALALVVDFKVVDVMFETPGVGAILDVTGFIVVTVTLLGAEAAGVTGFTVLLEMFALPGGSVVSTVELAVEFR